MLLVVPFLTLALMTAAWARSLGWRDGFLMGYLGLTGLWWASAVLLSPFTAFATPGIVGFYLLAAVVATTVLVRGGLPQLPPVASGLRNPWIVTLTVATLALLVVAVNVAPNNWDSMAYHLPKVEQWIQNRQVGPFRTSYPPQIYLAPLAEIGMAHFSLLGGTVWAVNLVQLQASVVTVVGVSVVARNCGLDRSGQSIAAAMIGLAPIAVAEAVTTQNDYAATALVVVAFAAASRSLRAPQPWWVLVTAVAVGLALCTKPTGAIFAAPAAVWSLAHLRHAGFRRGLAVAGGSAAVAMLVNVSWMLDNQQVFGSPLGPDTPDAASTSLNNEHHSLGVTVGNMVRNAGHVLALRRYPEVNGWIHDSLAASMSFVGIDPNQPGALFGSDTWRLGASLSEDVTGNAVQGFLLIGALVFCLAAARTRRQMWPLLACLFVGYVLFCLILKWQVWGMRLLLPGLAISAVVVAAWVSRWPRVFRYAVLGLLVYQVYPFVLQMPSRPLLGSQSVLVTDPHDELFASHPAFRPRYEEYTDFLTREPGARVGLQADMIAWEYPLWYLLKEADPTVTIGYMEGEGVGPQPPPDEWDYSLAWSEMWPYPSAEDWFASGLAAP